MDSSVRVEGNVLGSVVITGSDNYVTIVYSEEYLPSPSLLGDNPYQGLNAFDETSSHLFFGRERLIGLLIERFSRLTAPTIYMERPRLLAIVGPSGSGKSSLARAGLVPAIAKCQSDWLRGAKVMILRPGVDPIRSLAGALTRLVTCEGNSSARCEELEAELRKCGTTGLRDGLSRIARENLSGCPLVVLVDQFEELYALRTPYELKKSNSVDRSKLERDLFAEILLQGASEPSGLVSIVLTLRSDYLGALAEHAPMSAAIAESHEMIPAMGRSDLARAVAQPARVAGHPIDIPTVERILDQAADELSALPLVEFALEQIWERMRDNVSPAETLTALRGVGGAVANRAGEVFDRLSIADKKLARKALSATVHVSDVSARDTRSRAYLDEVIPAGISEDRLRSVLNAFADARLLSLGATEEGRVWYELPHETLIRNWDTLRGWIETQREDLRFARRLQHAAENWIIAQRARGALWRRPDLDLLRLFAARNVGSLTDLQLSFLSASERQYSFEWWSNRAAIAGLIVLATVATGFGIEALKYASDAQRNAKESNEHARNTESQRLLAEDRLALANRTQAELEKKRDEAQTNFDIARQAAENLGLKLGEELPSLQNRRAQVTREILRSALDLTDALASARPEDLKVKRIRFTVLTQITRAYLMTGDVKKAMSAAEECLRVLPSASPTKDESADCFEGAGDALLAGEDTRGAMAAYQKALDAFASLQTEDADKFFEYANEREDERGFYGLTFNNEFELSVAQHGNDVFRIHIKIGNAALALHDNDKALQQFTSVTEAPRFSRYYQTFGFRGVGNLFLVRNDLPSSIVAYQKSLAEAKGTVGTYFVNRTGEPDYEPNERVAAALEGIGDVQLASKNPSVAVASFKASLEIRQSSAHVDLSNAITQFNLSRILMKTADAEFASNKRLEAEQHYKAAEIIFGRLSNIPASSLYLDKVLKAQALIATKPR